MFATYPAGEEIKKGDLVAVDNDGMVRRAIKKFYFTFGQGHRHVLAGVTYDKDCVIVISAPNEIDARQKMGEVFGSKWSMCYGEKCPDMSFFPGGLKTIPTGMPEKKSEIDFCIELTEHEAQALNAVLIGVKTQLSVGLASMIPAHRVAFDSMTDKFADEFHRHDLCKAKFCGYTKQN